MYVYCTYVRYTYTYHTTAKIYVHFSYLAGNNHILCGTQWELSGGTLQHKIAWLPCVYWIRLVCIAQYADRPRYCNRFATAMPGWSLALRAAHQTELLRAKFVVKSVCKLKMRAELLPRD